MNDDEVSMINMEFAFIPGVVTAHIDTPVEEAETAFLVGQSMTNKNTVRTVPVIGVIVEPHRVVSDGDGKRAVGVKGAGNPSGVFAALAGTEQQHRCYKEWENMFHSSRCFNFHSFIVLTYINAIKHDFLHPV